MLYLEQVLKLLNLSHQKKPAESPPHHPAIMYAECGKTSLRQFIPINYSRRGEGTALEEACPTSSFRRGIT